MRHDASASTDGSNGKDTSEATVKCYVTWDTEPVSLHGLVPPWAGQRRDSLEAFVVSCISVPVVQTRIGSGPAVKGENGRGRRVLLTSIPNRSHCLREVDDHPL